MDKVTQDKRQKLVRLNVTIHQAVSAAFVHLKSPSAIKKSGMCYAWVREVMWDAGVPAQTFPKIATARLAFHHYQQIGWAMPVGTEPKAGDLLFKVGPDNGISGHVGICVKPDVVAENSSAHIVSEDDHDARGVRMITAFKGARVVRPPYLDGE